MPMPSTRSAWNGIVRTRDDAGCERGRPEPVAGPREAVRRRRPSTRSGSGRRSAVACPARRCRAACARVSPPRRSTLRRRRRTSSSRSPRRSRRRRAASAGHQVKCRPGKRSSAFSCCRSDVTCTCSAPPTCRVRCASASAIGSRVGRDVHVAPVRPDPAERAAARTAGASRSATTRPRAGCVFGDEIEHRPGRVRQRPPVRRVPRCASPARTEVEPRRAGRDTRGRERGERVGHGPAPVHEPLLRSLLVHVDGRAVHDREEWQV